MMNYIWVGLVVIAVVVGGATGNIQAVLDNIFAFAETAVDISFGLIGIMAFFCGLMNVMDKAGLCEKLGVLIAPVIIHFARLCPVLCLFYYPLGETAGGHYGDPVV